MVLKKKEKQINCIQRDLAPPFSFMRNEDFLIGGLKDADQHRGLPEVHTPHQLISFCEES